MTARERFEKILKDKLIFEDPDDIVEAVSEFLDDTANKIEIEESYATKTIKEYRDAAVLVYRMLDDE